MSQLYSVIALQLAHDRAREAEAEAARWRLARELRGTGDSAAARIGRARRLAASSLRWVSDIAGSVARATCRAATRLERRTA